LDYPEQVQSVIIDEGHHGAGRTPRELGLAEHGAELIDLRRDKVGLPSRSLDTRLRAGDVLVLKGDQDALEQASASLVEGP
jgi:CPA2 family monovalent cation:H+ antiporter-2